MADGGEEEPRNARTYPIFLFFFSSTPSPPPPLPPTSFLSAPFLSR
jgi:hypothetical protein